MPHSTFFHNQDSVWTEPYRARYKIVKWLKSATETSYVMSYTLSAFTVQ